MFLLLYYVRLRIFRRLYLFIPLLLPCSWLAFLLSVSFVFPALAVVWLSSWARDWCFLCSKSLAPSLSLVTLNVPASWYFPRDPIFWMQTMQKGFPPCLLFSESPAQETLLCLLTDTGFNSSVTIIIKEFQQWSLYFSSKCC